MHTKVIPSRLPRNAASKTTKKGKKTIVQFINFFAYFVVKNGIIFAYRWRGESRAVAAWKGARVEIEKAH
jgi:hypothetical protein